MILHAAGLGQGIAERILIGAGNRADSAPTCWRSSAPSAPSSPLRPVLQGHEATMPSPFETSGGHHGGFATADGSPGPNSLSPSNTAGGHDTLITSSTAPIHHRKVAIGINDGRRHRQKYTARPIGPLMCFPVSSCWKRSGCP